MIPLLLGLLGAAFCFGNSEVRRFENIAAKDIRASIHGDHAKVSVRTKLNGIIGGPLGDLKEVTIRASDFEAPGVPLFVQPGLSRKGIIRNLHIDLRDFTLAGLRIQELSSDIPDCHYDYALAISKHKIRLSQSGTGRGRVVIRDKDLEPYILRKFGEIKRVTVRIEGGHVHVEGYGEFLILKAPFSVDANLVAVDGTKLVLTDATITFNGGLADEFARKTLLDTLNPVVDLNKDLKLYDAIHVDTIDLHDGTISASGATAIPLQPVPDGVSSVWHELLR